MRRPAPQIRVASRDSGGQAVRDSGPRDLGTHPFREPVHLDPARARAGFYRVQLHDPAARGRAPHRLRRPPSGSRADPRRSFTRFPAGSRPASSRGGTSIITRSSAPPRTIPKRHHLSPKVNARWFKLLYCTPVLFPIYFRAARRESATYERRPAAADRQRNEGVDRGPSRWRSARSGTVFGFYAAVRTNIIPVFFVFPVAFTLNRLGQHYDIDPDDPAKWGTLLRGHWFWDFRVPEFQLPPGAPLLSRRAVLPAARPAARARAVLRTQGDAMADVRRVAVRVVRRESRAPHGLESRRRLAVLRPPRVKGQTSTADKI